MGITRFKMHWTNTTFVQRRATRTDEDKTSSISPKNKCLDFHMVGKKHTVHRSTLTMIGWIVGSRVHHKSIAMKVTNLSII